MTIACLTGCSGDGGGDGGAGSASGSSSGGSCKVSATSSTGIDLKADMQVFRGGTSLQVQSKSTVTVAVGAANAGKPLDTRLEIVNSAPADFARELRIRGVTLTYSVPLGGTDGDKPAFECLLDHGDGELPSCKGAAPVSLVPAGAAGICTSAEKLEKLTVVVRFHRPLDDLPRNGVLRIISENDDHYEGSKAFRVKVSSKVGKPALSAPDLVSFGTVKLGASGDKILQIANSGEADLLIEQLQVAPKDPKPFAIEFERSGHKVVLKGIDGAKVFEPKLIVKPQQTMQIIARYTAIDGFAHQGYLVIRSNDPGKEHKVKLLANDKVACLEVIPDKAVNFGFVPLGHKGKRPVILQSCGSDTVEITGLTVGDDPGGVFQVDTTGVATLGGKPIGEKNPIQLGTNEKVTIEVSCEPESAAKDVKPGQSQYMGLLGLADNTVQPDKKIALLCNGTATNCPSSVIVAQEGEEIVPQQELHLIGSQSFAGPNQSIAKYQWKLLKQPKGSEDHIFWPNANVPDPLFGAKTAATEPISGKTKPCSTYADCAKGQFCAPPEDGGKQKICYTAAVNIAGEYQFQLTVSDGAGHKNCQDAKLTVLVIPNEAIHVELLWTTPGDTDKLDKGLDTGSDMDLHFAHQTAEKAQVCTDPPKMCGNKLCQCQQDLDQDGKADPWFQSPFDTYWFNPNPNWGSADPAIDDNPGLDLDDTDGWGPENMNLNNPQNNTVYSVGVHYWDAHGFGESVANVRIYILGKLVADLLSTTMKQCDMWWVKRIEWPSGALLDYTDKAGKPMKNGKISNNYYTAFAATLGAKCAKK